MRPVDRVLHGRLFGAAVAKVDALRVDTLKKSVVLAVLYVEILSQPLLVTTPILLKMTTPETFQWFGVSFLMHLIAGAVLGLVICYGLRTDFRGELFEGSQYLLAWADNLIEIKTICHSGKKATMVVRVDDHGRAITEGPQVEIGGNERYVSVSRAEFKKIVAGEGRIELQQTELPLT